MKSLLKKTFFSINRRYIKDSERKELLDLAMSYCVQAFKDLLQKHGNDQRNDNEILTLLIEIFKVHKKLKNVSQKESPFSGVLVETYKSYAEGKVWLQEHFNYLDSANKFCVCLMNGMKNQEKQQQLTGVRQSLEELGMKNLGASLSKFSTFNSSGMGAAVTVGAAGAAIAAGAAGPVGVVAQGNQTPTGGKSPAVVTKVPVLSTPVPVITPTTMITTMASSTPITSTTNTTTITPVMSRPRGRPPGSRNSATKTTSDVAKNAAMQQKLMASILQPFAGSLSNLELITSQLDPKVKVTVLSLLAEPQFMQTLAMFPDPTSRNTLLREYFTFSNASNIPQLVDGFNTVFNYLASALQPQASMANVLPVQTKVPKQDKTTTVPKSSTASMSIFPTTSKPHPSLTTSPSKPSVSPSISATITPVPTSQSLLKSGASTVISVGSGQLTITPSISITPNATKPTSVLPQMPAPSFSVQKPTQPKARRSTGDKPTKASQKAQRLSLGSNYPELPPIAVENLPKSLSIIPSPSSFAPTSNPSALSPINVGLLANKPAKVPKPKKKSFDGNKTAAQTKNQARQMAGIDPNILKKSLTNQQLQQLNPLMSQMSQINQYNYLSHYQQFLSGVPPTTLTLPKASKSKTSTVTAAGAQQPKGGIKVKQLDQLQGRSTTKANEKAQKSKQQPFSAPNVTANVKNPPVSRSPTVLNAYGTTISSITQSIPTSFTPLSTTAPTTASTAANASANLQFR